MTTMRLAITGTRLPGAHFLRPDGTSMDNVHVGIQVRRDPCDLVRADRAEAQWETDVDVIRSPEGAVDFRGPAVQGKRGDRFVYLTWGHVHADGRFEMFRRAKLMLNRVDPGLVGRAVARGRLDARVDLTGDGGGPRCARVDPPAIEWTVDTGSAR
jgi:hypothetical protein